MAGSQHLPTIYRKGDPELAAQSKEASQCVMEFAMALAAEGTIISGGGKTYLSLATAPLVNEILGCYERVFQGFED